MRKVVQPRNSIKNLMMDQLALNLRSITSTPSKRRINPLRSSDKLLDTTSRNSDRASPNPFRSGSPQTLSTASMPTMSARKSEKIVEMSMDELKYKFRAV